MVEVIVSFLGFLSRKLNTRKIPIRFDVTNGGMSVRAILKQIPEKLPGNTERENYQEWVFDPTKPDQLKSEMAYVLDGRHLRPTKESLDLKISSNIELVIFHPDGGG